MPIRRQRVPRPSVSGTDSTTGPGPQSRRHGPRALLKAAPVPESVCDLHLPDLPPLTAWSLNATIFFVAGGLVAAWSRGLGATWSSLGRRYRWIRAVFGAVVVLQTYVVLYAAQWVTWQVVSEHGVAIADWEASTRHGAADAATTAFDVVPYAAREVLTGTAFFVLDDWPIIVGACVAVAAPLLEFLLGLSRRTPVRSAVVLAAGLVVVEVIDCGVTTAVRADATGTGCRTSWSFATFALILLANVAPTLLRCALAAGSGWLGRRAAERLDIVRLGGTSPGGGPLPAS